LSIHHFSKLEESLLRGKEKMKLLIFGSTGSIGRLLIEQALEQGHEVTAFARNPAKLDIQHPNLKVVQGDVLNLASVEQAVQGQDAVLCVLGSGSKRKGTIRSEGTRQIIRAMEKTGVRRVDLPNHPWSGR
jgi:putative NADH-flavin reductase